MKHPLTRRVCIVLCFVAIAVIILTAASSSAVPSKKEAFTPAIRRLYRPHLRTARLYFDGIGDYFGAGFAGRLARRWGLL